MITPHVFGELDYVNPEMLEVLPRPGDMIMLCIRENDFTEASSPNDPVAQVMFNRFTLNGSTCLVTSDPVILEIRSSSLNQQRPLMTSRSFAAVTVANGRTVWSDSRIGLFVMNHDDNCVKVYLELAIDEFRITRR